MYLYIVASVVSRWSTALRVSSIVRGLVICIGGRWGVGSIGGRRGHRSLLRIAKDLGQHHEVVRHYGSAVWGELVRL